MPAVKVCPTCELQNATTAMFCGQCANSLVGVEETEIATVPTGQEASPVAPVTETAPACVCGAPLPPGASHCLYCNRAVSGAQPENAAGFALRWPWGEVMPIQKHLFIGRVPPVADTLAGRLEREYPNVSRNHAELVLDEGRLYLLDHSLNGTFVDGVRLAAGVSTPVAMGATLRFAAQLEAQVVSATAEHAT